jgi:hypothetical protein
MKKPLAGEMTSAEEGRPVSRPAISLKTMQWRENTYNEIYLPIQPAGVAGEMANLGEEMA